MVKYYYVEEKLYSAELGNYTSYAISVYKHNDNQKTRIAYISDVFLDKSDAKRFVQRCNNKKLDPVHLEQVIEEALML